MPELSLAPGESRKIVSQPTRGEEYNLDVSGEDIYLSHNSSAIVNQGKQVRPGDRVTLENLEGKSIYAKNPTDNTNTATLDVSRASFNLIFRPRAVIGGVDTGRNDEDAPAASDDWDELTASGVDIGSGGSITEILTPPGRADQISLFVDGSAAFEVTVTWNNTSETYSSDADDNVKEVLPVFYISDLIDVTITDTSGGPNTVDYDMAVT